MFVQLDETSKRPIWLPETHVRFALKEYGIDQLVGAIKLRVQEQGGTIAKPDAASHARRTRREADFLAERARLFLNRAWIEGTVHASVGVIVDNAVQLVKEHGGGIQPQILAGAKATYCVMSDERVSVAAGWKQGIFNNAREEAYFFIKEFRGAAVVPGVGLQYMFEPKLLKEQQFLVEINATRELVWVQEGKTEMLSGEDLANRIAMIFFDLIGKANRGEVATPDF